MTKEDKVRLLLQSTSISKSRENGLKELLKSIPDHEIPKLSTLKQTFLNKFETVVAETFEKQVQLYSELLSEDAIDASLHFYSTAEGREIIEKLPQINKKLSEVSYDFTTRLAKDFFEALMTLGVTDEEMMAIGFHKVEGDLEEFIKNGEMEQKNNDDRITIEPSESEEFDQFLKDYGISD